MCRAGPPGRNRPDENPFKAQQEMVPCQIVFDDFDLYDPF
jgi:hypothetical protein